MSVQWSDSDYSPSEAVDRVLKIRRQNAYRRAPYHEYLVDKRGRVHATECDLLSDTVERFGRALRPSNPLSGAWIMCLAGLLAMAFIGGLDVVRWAMTGVWK